jgi:uncharacterized damage-inducible protein DinB
MELVMDPVRQLFLEETIAVYQQHKTWADQAIAQLDSELSFVQPLGPRSHSVGITIKHVAGNLRSRWLHFLTEDGEKPDRHRDMEFVITSSDTRASLLSAWEASWKVLFDELHALQPSDLDKFITIRGEKLSVIRAIQRSLAHTAYHVGQIMYLCRLLKEGEWKWLTIAPNNSTAFNEQMQAKLRTP